MRMFWEKLKFEADESLFFVSAFLYGEKEQQRVGEETLCFYARSKHVEVHYHYVG